MEICFAAFTQVWNLSMIHGTGIGEPSVLPDAGLVTRTEKAAQKWSGAVLKNIDAVGALGV
jgi:hypothetical protein